MTSLTPFTGLERLAPGEQLRSDGFKFQDIDRGLIDRALRIGCVTHRHDGHAALANPTTAPTVTTPSSGGTIGANITIYVGYTLNDEDAGETLISTPVMVTTPGGYAAPSAAPAANASYTAGTLMSGNYAYALTVTDGAGGETVLSPAALVSVLTGHANAEVTISGLAALLAASSHNDTHASWRLWRSQGGGPWYLIGTGTADSLTDTGIAGDCSVAPPTRATTKGTNSLSVTVPAAGQPSGATSFNIYASPDATFTNPCRLAGPLPISDFGSAQVFTALTLLDGAPPKVSTCFPGANPITGAAPGGSSLGVAQAQTTGTHAIAANATTTVAIPPPTGQPEQDINRVVVGLCIAHPDVSKLSVVLNDAHNNSATLFAAGTFVGTQIGSANFASDPDSLVYFSDVVRGYVRTDFGVEVYDAQLTASSAIGAQAAMVYVPVSQLAAVFGWPISDGLSLDITESGGSAGTLETCVVYYIDASFDALAIVPPPISQLPNADAAPAGDYTLAVADAGRMLRVTAAATVTIPADTFPAGSELWVGQDGAGQITFAGATGVTLKSRGGLVHSNGQNSIVKLWAQTPNIWWLSGDLV